MKKILITVLLSFLIYGTAFAQFGGPFGDLDNLVLDTDCSTYITEGLFCWDTDDEVLYVGNGTTVTSIDVSGSISTHNTDTSAVHGIADTSALVDQTTAETVGGKEFYNYSETCPAIGSDTTPTYDIAVANCYTDTIDTGETTVTFSNPATTGKKSSLTIILTNGGSQVVNWPASVDWELGVAPSLTAAGVDVLYFFTVDGGTIWYGFPSGLDMQ